MTVSRTTGLRDLLKSGKPPASLLRIPGVVGAGFSEKSRFGQRSGEVAVTVYVREKRAPSEIPTGERIPAWLEFDKLRVPTDVVQVNSSAPAPRGKAVRSEVPVGLAPGSPIFALNGLGPRGAFGCLVKDEVDGSTLVLTASGPASWWGGLSIGAEIATPSVFGGGDYVFGHLDRVAELSADPRLYPIDGIPQVNAFDGALVRPIPDADVSNDPAAEAMPAPSDVFNLLGIVVGREEVDQTGSTCYIVCPISAIMAGFGVEPYGDTATREASLGERAYFVEAGSIAPGNDVFEGVVSAVNATVGIGLERGTEFEPSGIPHVAMIGPCFLVEGGAGSNDANIGSAVYAWGGGGLGGVRSRCTGCLIALDLDETYELGLTQDIELADWVRDQYIMRTYTGAILVQLFYRNENQFRARMADVEPTETERQYAELLYTKYSTMVREEREGDVLTYVPITGQLLNDVTAALYGLSRFMTQVEYLACHQLLNLLAEARDMTVSECMTFMNQKANAERILTIIQSVPDWDFSYDLD